MVTKDKYSLDPNAWCGLNRPDMPLEEADTVLFGIPFDGGASYRAGAAQAPDMLRANTLQSTPCTERLEWFDTFNVVDAGNFPLTMEDREEVFADIQKFVCGLVKAGRKITMIGGDHSVTIPVERGIDDALDEPFGIIHIDAHMDLCDALEGDKLSHGNTERRALELKNIQGFENLYFIGIRSIEPDEFELYKHDPIQVISYQTRD